MLQRLVNQVYWSANQIFTHGTKLQMTKKRQISFQNSLMAPGRSISHWDSTLNYQGDKTVPQLPILHVGQEYRIVVSLKVVPASSYLIRLTFRDIQGTVIKQIDFRSQQRKFVFPEGAVTYSIDILNSGCEELYFERIQIGPANLPFEAFNDVWAHDPVNSVTPEHPLNIVLISDGKQARRTHPEINALPTSLPMQAISVSWQFTGNLREWLTKWLLDQQLTHFHIVSTASRFDQLAVEMVKGNPFADALITYHPTGYFTNYNMWRRVERGWNNDYLTDVDWQDVINEMKNVWEGGA